MATHPAVDETQLELQQMRAMADELRRNQTGSCLRMLLTSRQRIAQAIAKNGPYSHNIISLALRNIHQQEGWEAAQVVWKKYRLGRSRWGIQSPEEVALKEGVERLGG